MDAELIGKHREIVQNLIRQLPLKAKDGSDKAWTEAVKSVMYSLCREHVLNGSADCHATIKDISREWLLDVFWYVYGAENQEWVLLGLESEWNDGKDSIVWDFRRLLATKAPIKIMLFAAPGKDPRDSEARRQKIIEWLNDAARTWVQHTSGDHFYAIHFNHRQHATYYYQVRSPGEDKEFAFNHLPELTGPDEKPIFSN